MSDGIKGFSFQCKFFWRLECDQSGRFEYEKKQVRENYQYVFGYRPAGCGSGMSAYAASKSALLGFTKAVARDLGPVWDQCQCHLPGIYTDTYGGTYSQRVKPVQSGGGD